MPSRPVPSGHARKRRPLAPPREAYVWIWLPLAVDPVVAGRIVRDGDRYEFVYGASYRDRPEAVPLYLPELPLQPGVIQPLPGLTMAGCLRDAAPDAWGRRVILNRLMSASARSTDTAELDELTYLLESGSDRPGALDFQISASEYTPRMSASVAPLDHLMRAAERVDTGQPLDLALDQALFHGSSIGGARPKAMIEDGDRKHIAKFSSASDTYSVVKTEFLAMRLAARIGLSVAPVRLERVTNKDVLLVERFDRERTQWGWRRRAIVSALTMIGLDEMQVRYASYETLAEIVRQRFLHPTATLRELYGRLVFNVICGNTDDHARNHAAFWNGIDLTMTPAYDICPQMRLGGEASQAMAILGDDRRSSLALCTATARNFLLDRREAVALIQHQLETIRASWEEACDEAALQEVDRRLLRARVFLHPSIFEDAPAELMAYAGRTTAN